MTDKLYCSFCGKSQDEVPKLIAGPVHTGICNECVALCASILVAELDGNTERTLYLSRTPPVDSKAIIKEIVRELRDELTRDSDRYRDADETQSGSVGEADRARAAEGGIAQNTPEDQ